MIDLAKDLANYQGEPPPPRPAAPTIEPKWPTPPDLSGWRDLMRAHVAHVAAYGQAVRCAQCQRYLPDADPTYTTYCDECRRMQNTVGRRGYTLADVEEIRDRMWRNR